MSARRPVAWAVIRDLGRTGVPLALARLATWPGTAAAVDLHIVARTDGPLRSAFERAGLPVLALEPEDARSGPATVAAGAAYLGRPAPGRSLLAAAWRHRARGLPRPDVVLVQGAGAWPIAESLQVTEGPRVVVHLHELAVGLRRSLTRRELAAAMAADQVLAVSEPVAALARSYGAPAERIVLVPGTVDTADRVERGNLDVVTIGEAGWRKGTDRAIAAAHELLRREPGLRWHWIGRSPEPGWAFAHGADVPLTTHPPVAEPWAVVGTPAALVVTSREDPLPLVALEAGQRGIPVIACSGSGGLDHLLAEGRGWLVDPTDPRDLATTVQEVVADASNDRLDALRSTVTAHHTADVVGPAWLAALAGIR